MPILVTVHLGGIFDNMGMIISESFSVSILVSAASVNYNTETCHRISI